MNGERVVIDANIHHGKPIVRGTRVPIDIVLGALASRMTAEEVAEEYGIGVEDVMAVLAYASRLIAREEIRPLAEA